jgi:thioredoxin:protein disulfide reductase
MPKQVVWLSILLLAFPAAGDLLLAPARTPVLLGGKFLPVAEAFRPAVVWDEGAAVIRWEIAPGYYLYRHQLAFTLDMPHGAPVIPPGQAEHDDYFGDVEVYFNELIVRIPLERTPPRSARLGVRYQGCAVAGLCYPPQTLLYGLVGRIVDDGESSDISAKNPLESTELPGK